MYEILKSYSKQQLIKCANDILPESLIWKMDVQDIILLILKLDKNYQSEILRNLEALPSNRISEPKRMIYCPRCKNDFEYEQSDFYSGGYDKNTVHCKYCNFLINL